MDVWDIALLAVAGYLGAMGLARLMLRRRNQLVDELLRQAQREQDKQDKQAKKPPAGDAGRDRRAA